MVEPLRQSLEIGFGLHQRRHRIRRGHGVDQPRARGEGGPTRHADRTGHPGIAAHDDHPAPTALVVPDAEAPQPSGRIDVADQRRQPRIRRRVADVHHDHVSHLVPGEEVPPAESAEAG